MTALTRRAFLVRGAGVIAVSGAADQWFTRPSPALAACRASGFRVSLSVSPFSEWVLRRARLTDGRIRARSVLELQRLFMRHGASEVYARIATRKYAPQPGAPAEHGWAGGLERARLARRLGLPFNPELGLWAVIGAGGDYQEPPDFRDYPQIRLPGPWLTLTLAQMERALRQYGELVARQILATGVRVGMWDLGNEVDFGICGIYPQPLTGPAVPLPTSAGYRPPDTVDPAIGQISFIELLTMPDADRIAFSRAHLWPYVGRLLAATAAGIRSVDRRARFSTHISYTGRTPAVALAFWESVASVGYRPDQFGISYYPTSSNPAPADPVAWLFQTSSMLRRRFGRPTFLAEYAYPSGLVSSYPFNNTVAGYPQTLAGQYNFLRTLVQRSAKSDDIAGIRPWAPDLCDGGYYWAPMSFFTTRGTTAHAKPALHAITDGLRAAGC